ncbi:TetR/AcrR family transcriptional regulator [Fodinibius sp. Rm-B-1B1-1]|uniref:TetR/AcrR family transcriptional regulator n=1 Tax=Fodinibius alkaliphilus TaxID=3140241 RepID=UPI003159E925
MSDKNLDTQEQIFEAACRVFQRKGYAGARMQEIADEAEINKSMLHYYYRSKDKLFQEVFQREIKRLFPVIFGVLDSDRSLPDKIDELIDTYYSFLEDNPYLVQFVLHEMHQHADRFKDFIKEESIRPPKSFLVQIEGEVKQGNMDPVNPKQLMISIIGLILFPFIARTMIETIFAMEESDFLEFLKERKEFLSDFILNAINYKKP